MYDVLVWASGFACFMLGEKFLEQLLGLFQGCGLSVILSLMTAGADEDVWLGGLGNDRRLFAGLRYFDDRMIRILYWIDCAISEMRATELEKECTIFYMEGILCEAEEPPDFLESKAYENEDCSITLLHNNKNWEHILETGRQKITTQMPRNSFILSSMIKGHKISRLRSIVQHANSECGQLIACLQMIVEWLVCLGDTMGDVEPVLPNLIDMKRQPRRVWEHIEKVISRSGAIQRAGYCDNSGNKSDCSVLCLMP